MLSESWLELASSGQFDGQGDHHSPMHALMWLNFPSHPIRSSWRQVSPFAGTEPASTLATNASVCRPRLMPKAVIMATAGVAAAMVATAGVTGSGMVKSQGRCHSDM